MGIRVPSHPDAGLTLSSFTHIANMAAAVTMFVVLVWITQTAAVFPAVLLQVHSSVFLTGW